MARIASGGEMARMMLALKTILASSDHTPTLIFDEVDSGVGGRLGQVLGRKLWGLGRSHQVIVTTHLPQLAAFADRHFLVRKVESAGRTLTQVEELRTEEERLAELTAMQGMAGEASRESARELRAEAEGWKGRMERAH